ncbi:hypothetical protein DIPPA_12160, partial [Diplonema papillatum]
KKSSVYWDPMMASMDIPGASGMSEKEFMEAKIKQREELGLQTSSRAALDVINGLSHSIMTSSLLTPYSMGSCSGLGQKKLSSSVYRDPMMTSMDIPGASGMSEKEFMEAKIKQREELGLQTSSRAALDVMDKERLDLAKQMQKDLFSSLPLDKIVRGLQFCDDDQQQATLYLMQADSETDDTGKELSEAQQAAYKRNAAFNMSQMIFTKTTRELPRIEVSDSSDEEEDTQPTPVVKVATPIKKSPSVLKDKRDNDHEKKTLTFAEPPKIEKKPSILKPNPVAQSPAPLPMPPPKAPAPPPPPAPKPT